MTGRPDNAARASVPHTSCQDSSRSAEPGYAAGDNGAIGANMVLLHVCGPDSYLCMRIPRWCPHRSSVVPLEQARSAFSRCPIACRARGACVPQRNDPCDGPSGAKTTHGGHSGHGWDMGEACKPSCCSLERGFHEKGRLRQRRLAHTARFKDTHAVHDFFHLTSTSFQCYNPPVSAPYPARTTQQAPPRWPTASAAVRTGGTST